MENPYQSPQSVDVVTTESPQPRAESLAALRLVAQRHRLMLISVVAYMGSMPVIFLAGAVADRLPLVAGPLLGLVFFFGPMFFMASAVARLDMALEDSALAVIHWLLALFPCFNLLVLFAVNRKATKILRHAGFRVGLLGADMMQFSAREGNDA